MSTTSAVRAAGGSTDLGVLISADSHVIEPLTLWKDRLPGALKAKAPTLTKRGGDKPGAEDPANRVEIMKVDGVSFEVLYPTYGLGLFGMEDPDLQEGCCEVYNDWAMEYCAHHPDRLVAIPCIPMYNVQRGIKELERTTRAGMKGGLIWQVPHPDYPFTSDHYEPFWEAAQALGAPVNIHILTGFNYTKDPVRRSGVEHFRSSVNLKTGEAADMLVYLIFSGVLERYPDLKIVIVESEIGWIPFYLQQWDYYYRRFLRNAELAATIPNPPSYYFNRQVYATFFNDNVGAHNFDWFGTDRFMWSNDFPHGNTTWPDSKKVIERDLGHLPADVQAKLVRETVVDLYDLKVPEPV